MANPRIIVHFDEEERKALFSLALAEKRDARQQVAFLVRRQLEQLGLIRPVVTGKQPEGEKSESTN